MTSREWFERARQVIPGGVNSPVRAFQAVGGEPVYVLRGAGAEVETADGRRLIDFCGSWGPLILGHAAPAVVAAAREAIGNGTSFGINTPQEVVFAELLCDAVPELEMVRLVNSGTEAVMTAVRLARGVTGRRRIVKFDGGYHGHSDGLLVGAGSGLLTGGISASRGVSAGVAAEALVPPYNDLEAVSAVVERHGDDLAAIVVEPVAGNMGLVPPAPGFLAGLRELADGCGALLVFDEVITGFRLGPTSYAALCGITPDLSCLGKIIGGGMPIGAVGGARRVMEQLAPCGTVYQAGTLSGNPVAVAAGLATVRSLIEAPPYERLAAMAERLAQGLNAAAADRGVEMHCARLGSMFTPFFTGAPVYNLADAKRADTTSHAGFFRGMLERGFYLPPSQFEVGFVSAAHAVADVDRFVRAADDVLAELAAGAVDG